MNRLGKRFLVVLLVGILMAGSFYAGRFTSGDQVKDVAVPPGVKQAQDGGGAGDAPDGQASVWAQLSSAPHGTPDSAAPPAGHSQERFPSGGGTPWPSPSPSPAFSPLSSGSQGEEVQRLQERLTSLGYAPGRADGVFGGKTRSALEDFQRTAGLKVTGIADQQTQSLLYSAAALAYTRPATPEPTLRPTPEPTEEPMVWIPRTGKRYHRRESCSNMKDPSHVTLSQAIRLGFTPCKKCY